MENIQYLILLTVSSILSIAISILITLKSKRKGQINSMFSLCLVCMLIWTFSLILQILFQNSNIDPVLFEGFASFGACFLPVAFMFLGIIFSKTKIYFSWKYALLLVIPIISTVLMFTNGQHNLFFKQYDYNRANIIIGPYNIVNGIYSYACMLIGLIYLLKYTIKNSGFFSKQSLLIALGGLIPSIVNILTTFNILNLTVYATPISFSVALLLFSLAIFKFDFLKVTPIALQRIVDRMSDGYIVVDDANFVTDFNETFLSLFFLTANEVRNASIRDLLNKISKNKEQNNKFLEMINFTKNNNETQSLERHFSHLNKYFNIEINSINSDSSYLGTLILFKDITQHKKDMQTIKNNQEILIERERLATLGQMIGGIAHNLKTPIMSISGATEGILDLVNEYKNSISDPEVTIQDHLEIAGDMEEWIHKIQSHLSYMSDVITTVKGQAVAFSDNTTFTSFTIDDFVRQVNILMKHELSKALIELEEKLEVPEDTVVKGNINSLVQVVNNIISNAIQAYDGKPGEKIILDIYKEKDNLIFKIQDFAGGLPSTVKSKLFKEMVTTKGKNGTGLGLFMSYSNIRAHFNGDIRFDSRKGKGTTFYIEIPYGGRRTEVGSWKIGIRK